MAAIIVVYHLFDFPLGGVVGVDVFFVISGFLITSLLLRELATTNRISLAGFYARRARRILPVAVVVVLVTIASSSAVWFLPRTVRIGLDGLAAATFVENWHLIGSGRSYLQHDAGVSPLQHYWSLAVEEQFYVVWPLVVIAAGVAASSLAHRVTATLLVSCATGVGFSLSALYSASHTSGDIDAAYFDTFARAWEFTPGILAALWSQHLSRVPRAVRSVGIWLGILLIALACCVIDPHHAFPWPNASFAALGTALIVSFGAGHRGSASKLLSIPPARWLGKRSYSLYLWHFPAAILLPAVLGRSWWALSATLLVTVVIAAVSYRWIELPALTSSWPRRGSKRPPEPSRGRDRRRASEAVGVGLLSLVIVGTAIAQVEWPNRLGDPTSVARWVGVPRVSTTSVPQHTEDDIRADVTGGLALTEWPAELAPRLDRSFDNVLSPAFDAQRGCRNDPAEASLPQTCLWNAEGDRTAYLIGDSTATAWAGGITRALVGRGWRVEAAAYSGCSPFAVRASVISANSPASAQCIRSRGRLTDLVAAARPDLVIVSGGVNSFVELSDVRGVDAASAAWRDGARSTVNTLKKMTKRLVVLENPPAGESVLDCATRWGSPAACETSLTTEHRRMNEAVESGVADAEPGASFVRTHQWFCNGSGRCPIVIGSLLVRPDRSHITDMFATSLGRLLRQALFA